MSPQYWSPLVVARRAAQWLDEVEVHEIAASMQPDRSAARQLLQDHALAATAQPHAGTLEEVVNAHEYFEQRQIYISRLGRDFPGSNWALYVLDPDGHRIEFYYGMERGAERRSRARRARAS